MIEIMQVKMPYQVSTNGTQTIFSVFYNAAYEAEIQDMVGTPFVKTALTCLGFAELYRFGSTAAFTAFTEIVYPIDFQKAAYWHLNALYWIGDNWTNNFDTHLLSEDYKKALNEFLQQEMITLNLQSDNEKTEAAWNQQQLNRLTGEGQ